MTLGRLATHVAELPSWAVMTLSQETVVIGPDYKPHFAADRAELLTIFDKNVADARARIETATDEDWGKTWTLKFGDRTVFSMPRTAVVRAMVMNGTSSITSTTGCFSRLHHVEIPMASTGPRRGRDEKPGDPD